VEFNIRDGGEGAAQPNQHYAMVIDESRKGVFQAGNRVSVTEGSLQGPYYDVGIKMECAVRGSNGKVALSGRIELSKIDGRVSIGGITEPVIGQTKMTFNTSVELGTPTAIVDERTSAEGKHQVEATVTKVQ
jgi:hypothetical protein